MSSRNATAGLRGFRVAGSPASGQRSDRPASAGRRAAAETRGCCRPRKGTGGCCLLGRPRPAGRWSGSALRLPRQASRASSLKIACTFCDRLQARQSFSLFSSARCISPRRFVSWVTGSSVARCCLLAEPVSASLNMRSNIQMFKSKYALFSIGSTALDSRKTSQDRPRSCHSRQTHPVQTVRTNRRMN